MKFYETHYEEYIRSVDKYNFHPELTRQFACFPETLSGMKNVIVYGPSGSGKYSQTLHFIKKYSPSLLKYDTKVTINTDKQIYTYRISDIHYEIDMSLLGCNSKFMFHEIYQQIVDIVSMNPDKKGIIMCKNFHSIHNELLDIFYSYIQQALLYTTIQLKFIIITEHLSFIPNNVVSSCYILSVPRPSKSLLVDFYRMLEREAADAQNRRPANSVQPQETFFHKIASGAPKTAREYRNILGILESVDAENVINMKEVDSFAHVKCAADLPRDNFNVICDNIIAEMTNYKTMGMHNFRDVLYDILIYNIDVPECIWHVIFYFIRNGELKRGNIRKLMNHVFISLKFYQNNYRPIFHLENIFLKMIQYIYE
jgi:hypothetical protein